MKRSSANRRLLIVLHALGPLAWCQITPTLPPGVAAKGERYLQMVRNRERLEVTLKLDRLVYFPGEQAHVVVRVANHTAETLEVFEPFGTATNQFRMAILRKSPAGWIETTPDERFAPSDQLNTPTTYVYPTDVRELSSDLSSACSKLHSLCDIPRSAGDYLLSYEYGGQVEFRVVRPNLEHSVVVLLPTRERLPLNDGTSALFDRRLIVIVLEYNGTRFLAVSEKPHYGPLRVTGTVSGPMDVNAIIDFVPYVRVAEIPYTVTSLRASADVGDNVTIHCQDSSGTVHSYTLDPTRKLSDER